MPVGPEQQRHDQEHDRQGFSRTSTGMRLPRVAIVMSSTYRPPKLARHIWNGPMPMTGDTISASEPVLTTVYTIAARSRRAGCEAAQRRRVRIRQREKHQTADTRGQPLAGAFTTILIGFATRVHAVDDVREGSDDATEQRSRGQPGREAERGRDRDMEGDDRMRKRNIEQLRQRGS